MEKGTCFLFFNPLLFDDVVEEFSPLYELHDEEEILGGLYDLIELYNVGMPDEFEDVDFPGDSFHICDVDYLGFIENLDGHVFPGGTMDCQLDLAECPMANCPL
jgi:hypothetical protein